MTSASEIDLLALRQALGRRLALFFVVLCVTGSFPAWLTMGRSAVIPRQQSYLSTGKLLLRPTSQRIDYLGSKVELNPLRNRASQMWFQDFDSVRKVLADDKFLAKVVARVPQLSKDLNPELLKARIFAYPSSLNVQTLSELFQINSQELSGQAEGGAIDEFEGSADEVNRRYQLQLITVTVSGSSPDESETLAKSVLDEFLKEARRLASHEYTQKCRTLEDLRDRARQQLSKITALLKQRSGSVSPEERLDLQVSLGRQLNSLQGRLATLQGELAAKLPETKLKQAKRHDPAKEKPATDAALDAKISQLRSRKLAEEAIYQPDSQTVRATSSQLESLEKLQQQLSQRREDADLQKYAIFEKAAQAEIARLQQEIQEIVRVLGDPKENYEAAKLRRTQEYWENSIVALTPQLYQARLEERQALASGSLVVIQKPYKGFTVVSVTQVTPWYVGVLAFSPIALFFAATVCLAVDQFHRRRKLEYQLSHLGLLVWGRVSTLPESTSRKWNEVKFRSPKS